MENNQNAQNTKQPPATVKESPSRRFTNLVISNFTTNVTNGVFSLTERQRVLIEGYFITIDRTLKAAEEERLRKNNGGQWDNLIPYDWNHVNMLDLSLDAVYYARMGLDMQEKNHLFPIPYANKKGGYYNITFMEGYSGVQYIAEKYAADPPKNMTVEVVYSNDHFKPIKKSIKSAIESYEFDIPTPFDRGEIVGGFGYIEYEDPAKNKLIFLTKAAMDKRKPKHASANFWGGESTEWVSGQKQKVQKEGWQDEMYYKTMVREVYKGKHIPRDPSKLDESYNYLKERQVIYAQIETENEATENANSTPIDFSQANPEPPPAQAEPLSGETATDPTSDDNPEPPPQEKQAGYVQPDI